MEDRFETFTILISRINRSIRKIKNQEMADWGLKSIHVSCLYYLRSQGSLTAAELCERCEEDKAAVSRAIDHLKSEGFIEASTNGAKPYKCPLVLTRLPRKSRRCFGKSTTASPMSSARRSTKASPP